MRKMDHTEGSMRVNTAQNESTIECVEANSPKRLKRVSSSTRFILFSFFLGIGCLSTLRAQVVVSGGTTAVSGSPYATISAAITALNAGGAFSAPVTLDVAAGHTETLTSAIVLSVTGTFANPLTIQKSGVGANPIITGYTGINAGATATGYDAMFILHGADYVTINGINLNGIGGTSTTDAMEIGYALIKNSATDGSQYNTIMNCTVNMSAQFSVYGIAIVNYSLTSITALDATTPGGSNSHNTVKSCELTGATGVFMRAYAAPAPYELADIGNTVGGNSPADGNVIKNWGGYTTNGVAVFVNHQWGYLVKYNTINNNDGSHFDHNGASLRGIFCNISGAGAGGEVSFNDISLKYNGAQTGTTIINSTVNLLVGIEMKTSNVAGTAGNTVSVNNNYIHNLRYTNSAATMPCAGIVVASLASNVHVKNNEITDIVLTSTAKAIYFYGILNLLNVPTFLTIENNNIHDITNFNSTQTMFLVSNSTATQNLSFSNNTLNNCSRTAANAGTMYGYYNVTAPTAGSSNIRNNTISAIANGTGQLSGIHNDLDINHVCKVNLNTVTNLSSNSTSALYGIYDLDGAAGSSIDSNTVTIISNLSSGSVYGVYQSGTTSTFGIGNNQINTISSAGSVYGIYGAGTLNNIFNNKIHGLSTLGAASQSTYGIYLTTSTQMNVYNNLIYNLSADLTTSLTGLNGIYVNLGTNVNIVHNTIYPTSSTPFVGGIGGGATGVYMAAATNGVIDNNIIYLTQGVGASGNGFVTAVKRSSGTAAVSPSNLTLKSNILYAPYVYAEGSSSASAVNVYHTGTGLFGTSDLDFNTPCGLFKTFMSGAADGTFAESNLSFLSGVYQPVGTSFAESGAFTSSPNPLFDFLGAIRGVPADIGAVEFVGSGTDAAAPNITYAALNHQNCANNPTLSGTVTDATGVNFTPGSAPRIYYKKSTETNVYSPASPNDASYNGWKYIEASGTGPSISFTLNYSLLTSPVVAGETIDYFVVAQDVVATPNVGKNAANFQAGVCPTSVNLQAGAFPVSGYASFTILVPSTITVAASPLSVCVGTNVTFTTNVINSGTAVIGTGTQVISTTSPYNGTSSAGRRNQFIFTASELTAAGISPGAISSISLEITAASGFVNIPDLIVSMGHTSESIATSAYLTDPTTALVNYTGTGYLPAQGLNTHVFSSPFIWNGTSNVFIEMCHGVLTGTAGLAVRYQASAGSTVTYSTNSAGCSYTGTGAASTSRPFVTFNAQVSVSNQYNFAWSNGIGPVGGNTTTLIDQPTFPSGPMTYSVLATDGIGCTASGNVVVSPSAAPSPGTSVISSCSPITWIDGNNYSASNNSATYTLVGGASNGCDSIVNLNFTLNSATSGTDVISSCSPITWMNGTTYSASNNTATHTLTNAAGCDSIVTLNLTVNSNSTSTDTQAACGSYTWINGTTYTASNNTATYILTNAAGCDSIVTLNLTLNGISTSTDTQSACGSYTWIDGNTYTSDNTTATFTLTNAAGCDSIVTLNLNIGNGSASTDTQSACGSYTWIDGNTYTANNTTATVVLSNSEGCDSIVTLDLSITNGGVSTVTQSADGIVLTADEAAATHQWVTCPSMAAIVGETGQSFTATANGSYAVIITNGPCVDTSACVSVTNVGIFENELLKNMSVFPNPTNGKFTIQLGDLLNAVTISITDLTGKRIVTNTYYNAQNLNLELDAPAGVYLVIIESDDKQGVLRLVKK